MNNSFVPNNTATAKHGIMLILVAIMPAMAIISIVPVLPLLLQEFSGVEGAEFLVPIAMTVPALCVALFSPLAGWISDKSGRKKLLVGALLIYAFIGFLPYFLTDLYHIIVSRVVLGIAEAVIMTLATALIGDYFHGKEREKWVATQVAAVSMSAIILIALGGLLGELIGSRGPFLLYLLAIPIAIGCSFILFDPIKSQENKAEPKAKVPLKLILPLLLITLYVGLIFYIIIVKLGVILGLTGSVSPAIIGGIGAAANIGVALGSFTFSKMKNASGPKLIAIGLSLSAIGYIGAALSSTLWLTSVSLVVASFGAGMLLPTMLTWVLSVLPDNVRGRGTGMWTGVFFFGQFAAPIVSGAAQGVLGSFEGVLLLFAILSILSAMIALIKTKDAKSITTE